MAPNWNSEIYLDDRVAIVYKCLTTSGPQDYIRTGIVEEIDLNDGGTAILVKFDEASEYEDQRLWVPKHMVKKGDLRKT